MALIRSRMSVSALRSQLNVARRMRCIGVPCIILLALGAGCSVVDVLVGDPQEPPDQGHYSAQFTYPANLRGFGNPWIGQHADQLVAALGTPDLILEARPKFAPFPDGIHVLSYIYSGNRSTSMSCIDTYVVVEATGMIVKYYCR